MNLIGFYRHKQLEQLIQIPQKNQLASHDRNIVSKKLVETYAQSTPAIITATVSTLLLYYILNNHS